MSDSLMVRMSDGVNSAREHGVEPNKLRMSQATHDRLLKEWGPPISLTRIDWVTGLRVVIDPQIPDDDFLFELDPYTVGDHD